MAQLDYSATEQSLRAQRDIEFLEKARAAHRAELAQIERRITAAQVTLRLPYPDVDRP